MSDQDFLISLYFCGEDAIEQTHLEQLSKWIVQSPDNAQRFARAAFLNQAIHESVVRDNAIKKGFLCQEEPGVQDDLFWQILAQEEKTAPATRIPRDNPPQELLQKVVYSPIEKRKVSKSQIIQFAISAAAILFIVLFLKFAPQKQYKVDVATVADQLNAVWTSKAAPQTGSRLWSDDEPLNLQKGIVKVRYDDGVEVLIEGPALFEVRRSEVFLEYGRLYSRVAQTGLGFAVRTPTSNFIDMGTEFGVYAGINGSSELHVTKGKVQLFAGKKGGSKTGYMVTESDAVRYNANTDQVSSILFEKNAFVRQVNSKTGTIWRGQDHINLADIVGGGNGFEGGLADAGIEASTGKPLTSLLSCYPFEAAAGYRQVSSSPFIDGVFIPAAQNSRTAITSDGSSVTFPNASGRLWGYIFNGAFHQGTPTARSGLQLNGVVYGTPDYPAITIHSNQGITFDLAEIRRSLPGVSITGFQSLAGISQTVQELLREKPDKSMTTLHNAFNADKSKVEFWVFLDGQEAFHREMSSDDKAANLEIPLSAEDRFLTLAVTESDDGVSYDWALFGRPQLIFKSADR